jgi:undecaprenyl diphosphate synthase
MSNISKHIAIIMDGNGRWAEAQGLKRVKGHEKGADVIRDITTYCANTPEIERLTLYAFSTENWKRPKLEVEFLMKLLERYLKQELPVYLENGVRFEPIGDLTRFSKSLQKLMNDVVEKTAHCDRLVQSLALNYGSKNEIVRAVNCLIDTNQEVTEESITATLDSKSDVDLLIRTGGDKRLSNYMLWQAAYAELFFTETLWPDFSANELQDIINSFTTIERRFGGLKSGMKK